LNSQNPINGVLAPCIYDNVFFISWDLSCHQTIPTVIIVIFSIALLIRILYQKAHLRRKIQWRKQRKMTIQLLSITVLYQLFNFPWAFVQLCSKINVPVDGDGKGYSVAYFLPYYLVGFFPFVCCGTLPDLRKKLKKLLFCQRPPRVVRPIIIPVNRIQSNQTFPKDA
jgi:hypothetical protein